MALYILENYILDVRQYDADTLKEQTQKLPLKLRTFGTVATSTVQRETQMYLSNNRNYSLLLRSGGRNLLALSTISSEFGRRALQPHRTICLEQLAIIRLISPKF